MSNAFFDVNKNGEFDDIAASSSKSSGGKKKKTGGSSSGTGTATQAVPGTILRVKIHTQNWNGEGDVETLDCGAFEIDSCDLSGPPAVVAVKALSTPVSTSIRREEKNRAWEDVTLQKVAQDIAGDAGLTLMYEVKEEIELDRVDQIKRADLPFLQTLCHGYGVSVKVTDNKIVLFDEADYEQKDAVDTFSADEARDGDANQSGRILSYKFSQDTTDTVSKSTVSYKDPKSGKLVTAEFEPPQAPATGQELKLNTRPGKLSGDKYREALASGGGGTFGETAGDFSDVRADVTPTAMRQAKAAAREKNKGEWTAELTVVGNMKMVAGVTVNIEGWGVFDGKYIVEEAAHTLGGGYTTRIKAHRVLEGY